MSDNYHKRTTHFGNSSVYQHAQQQTTMTTAKKKYTKQNKKIYKYKTKWVELIFLSQLCGGDIHNFFGHF